MLGTGHRFWVLGIRAKSKVVIGASSYALAWPFLDPMHLSALNTGHCTLELGVGVGHRALER